MPYVCKMISENVMELISCNFTWGKTISHFWYFDIKEWKRSVTGKENEIPTQPMIQSEIDWVTKYYLPRTRKNN